MAISAPAVPGSAEAVRQAGRTDVKVIGLSLPNINKPYVHDGVVQAVILWNTRDLGYLTVLAAAKLTQGAFAAGATSIDAGRLGRLQVRGSEIILGAPLLMNKGNIDKYRFLGRRVSGGKLEGRRAKREERVVGPHAPW